MATDRKHTQMIAEAFEMWFAGEVRDVPNSFVSNQLQIIAKAAWNAALAWRGPDQESDDFEAELTASAHKVHGAIENARSKMTDREREIADREAQAILERASAPANPSQRLALYIDDDRTRENLWYVECQESSRLNRR